MARHSHGEAELIVGLKRAKGVLARESIEPSWLSGVIVEMPASAEPDGKGQVWITGCYQVCGSPVPHRV